MAERKKTDAKGGGKGARLVHGELALGMAVFGSATPISKIVTGAMPVFVGSGLRVAIGALALAPFAARHLGQLRGLGWRDWGLIGLISLFGMFGFSALMLYGMKMVPGVVGAIVMSTAPAVTAAASMTFLGDSPTWRKLTSIGLAVSGVLILQVGSAGGETGGGQTGGSGQGGKDTGDILLGSALVFGAVCCEAAYTLLGKKASERIDPVLVACVAAALAIPLFLPFAIWQLGDFSFADVDWQGWSAVVWYGAGTLALGSWLWYRAIARVEGAVAAAFMGVMPASALVLSYILLGEPFRWIHIAGFAVVFAGVLLMSWEHARMSRAG